MDAGIHGDTMDGFVGAEGKWAQSLPAKAKAALGMTDDAEAASVGDESMAHVDCDTIPYLWMYASRFALYDSFFQGARAPSAPSNVEIIAAQNGETEYARYGAAGPPYTAEPKGAGGRGVPMFVDLDPAWGPYNTADYSKEHQVDQTYANVLLNLEGAEAGQLTKYTQDIGDDIAFLRTQGSAPVGWTWYQQGYANPKDPGRVTLVTHHLAPHYFGYVANNQTMDRHVADITQFASDVEGGKLGDGGLFYLKGGFGSNQDLHPANAAPFTFTGDDDHPGESDSQIAEADVAALVNEIARSKYWSQSAIVITWDDPGGFWDHVPPPKWLVCPDGHPCGNGQRVPMLLISPYARTGVVHENDDQASVIKFVEHLFDRTPLAKLPDEARYAPIGPRDASDQTGDLSGGFDEARLRGDAPPIPAEAGDDSRRRRAHDPQPVVVQVDRRRAGRAAGGHVGRAAGELQSARLDRPDASALKAMRLAELLQQHRAQAHLSQEELAERAGVSPRTIGDIGTGISEGQDGRYARVPGL